MHRYLRFVVACAGVALLAIPAWGQTTFSYSNNFNNDPVGLTPVGWSTANGYADPAVTPRVEAADPNSWGVACTSTPSGCSVMSPAGCGRLGILQDYTVPWSGGQRFTLLHPAWRGGSGWGAVAWYAGGGTGQTGSYPMNLQTDKLRIEFDMVMRSGDNQCGETPADGSVFAVMPVTDFATDITRIGSGGGGMGWGGLYGFAIEFDDYDNGQTAEVQADHPGLGVDAANHIGLDVNVKWNGGQSWKVHQDPPASLGEGVLPRFTQVGDNNQPLHTTIYYNDPNEGGPGVVRVYLKVDPNTYPGSGGIGIPISFGMDSGHPDGKLVLEACVGPWPTAGAIFGMTGSTGCCTGVTQIDNLVVTTAAMSGQSCDPGVKFDPGPVVNAVDPASDLGPCDGVSEQGWDVTMYPTLGNTDTPSVKSQVAYFASRGVTIGSAHAVPDLNYEDTGCGGLFGSNRKFPGMEPAADHNNFAMVAKGFICFPPDDPNDPNDNYPRDYAAWVESDDGFEVKIGYVAGNDDPAKLIGEFNGGRGCGGGTGFTIRVAAPGVYTIQVLYYEGGGGAGIEFRRRIANDNLLAAGIESLIGPPNATYPDQPVVYSRYNGQPAPDLVSAWSPMSLPVVQLSPSQKLGDASVATGNQVWKVMATAGPFNNVEERNWEDDTANLAIGWCDTTIGFAANATSQTVNFREPGQGDGLIPNGSNFPGLSSTREQFGFRAQGYIVFPAAATYVVGVDSDDDAWVKIGKQTIYSTGCCPNTRFELNVTDPGTYPVRVYLKEGGGDARVEFYQYLASGLPVCVNDPTASIKVYESATTGEYDWDSNYWNVPASRKVADHGQGGELGWNATLGKAPAGATMSAALGLGITEVVLHNNFAGWPGDPAILGTDTPNEINYTDTGEGGGNFSNDRSVSNFNNAAMNPAGGNDQFAVGASCYLDIPAAGTYAFGLNGDDGMQLWIGGEIVVTFPYDTGPQDFSPGFVHFEAAGLYEARVISWENGGGYSMEFFQYLPDGSRALINSDQATVKAYRTLADGKVAAYDPVSVPASAMAATLDRGADSGARVRIVTGTFLTGNGDGGVGHEKLHLIPNAVELLDSVLGVKPSLSQFGTLESDKIEPAITLSWEDAKDDFAVRATGYLALPKGGYIFSLSSDDGSEMRINGNVVGRSQHLKGASERPFAVIVEADGLYEFTLDMFERGGGASCTLSQYVLSAGGWVPVNTGDAVKMYAKVNACPIPFPDADLDGDVDQMDFGVFQACFTGMQDVNGGPPVIPEACSCFNKVRDNYIDALDFAALQKCYTGPDIPWSQALTPDCVP